MRQPVLIVAEDLIRRTPIPRRQGRTALGDLVKLIGEPPWASLGQPL